ncbi:MAG: GIY-YIG nuclease family protein [Candidatus Pacebacteria bacterium]|nr:GIY-YIG nuclease family protein [Candidatus Paceibacterota bacterium]
MYYVYILKSEKDESIYVGYTNDLKRRFVEHNEGQNTSTKHKIPFQLIYYESYKAQADAKHREKQLKRFSGSMTHLKNRIRNSLGK